MFIPQGQVNGLETNVRRYFLFKVRVVSYQVGRKVHKVRRNKDGPFLFLKQQGINLIICSLIMCLQIISNNVKMLNDLGVRQKLQLYYKDHFPSLNIFLFQESIDFEPSPFTLSIP
jgi:hypothetical protein